MPNWDLKYSYKSVVVFSNLTGLTEVQLQVTGLY